jgi:outer membrane receptor protein involved in Fe transport
MTYGLKGRARWGVSTIALLSAIGAAVPAFAQTGNEIVITATRRAATTVQDVPLSVMAIGGDTVQNAGIKDVRDLTQLSPSFNWLTGQSNSAGATAYIRGVGTGGDNPGFESAVGFFVDGVYQNRAGVALSELPAVDRIEVIRGPQGTLFGKNTSAGAISVITAAPTFKRTLWADGSYGNLNAWGFSGGVSGAVADNVALRVDGNMRQRDGYIHDLRSGGDINDTDRWFVRGQALVDFNDNTTLRMIVHRSQTNEQCCAAVTLLKGAVSGPAIDAFVTGPLTGFIPGLMGVLGGGNVKARNTTVTPIRNYGEDVDSWGVSGELNTKLWGTNFTSITSYNDWKALRNQDIDFSDLDRAYRSGYSVAFKTFTQEFRFQGKSGALDWLLGAYYAKESLPLKDTIRIGADGAEYVDILAAGADLNGPAPGGTGYTIYGSLPLPPAAPFPSLFSTVLATPIALGGFGLPVGAATAYGSALLAADPVSGDGQAGDNFKQQTDSWALFTHNEIALAPNVTLTIGLRYNHEKKDLTADLTSVFAGCNVLHSGSSGGIPNSVITGAILAAAPTTLGGLLTLVCNPAVNTIANGGYAGSINESEWSGTSSLAWKADANNLFYVSYSRGYKAGGFNLDRSGFHITPATAVKPLITDLSFRPELVDAYEAGWKWTLFGGSTSINTSVFDEIIHDYQENAFSGFNFLTFNIPKTTSRGVEVDYFTELGRGFTMQGGLTYLEAFYNSSVTLAGPPAQTLTAGTPLDRAPKWAATSAITYETPAGAHAKWLFSLDGRWTTKYRVQVLSRNPATDNSSYAIFNARMGFGASDGDWMLEGWVKNFTDKLYHVGAFQVPEQTGVFDVYPNPPRTFGGTLRIKY